MNIELFSTEDLIEELLSRFDHAIFSGIKMLDLVDNRAENTQRWVGGTHTCAGMCAGLANDILDEFNNVEEIPEDEEDDDDDKEDNVYN